MRSVDEMLSVGRAKRKGRRFEEGLKAMKQGQLRINGSIPCVICWEALTQAEVNRGQVMAVTGKMIYPACLKHFFVFDGEIKQSRDYRTNRDRLAIAFAIGEGSGAVPPAAPRLKPVYDELLQKMQGWNHPAFIVRENSN